MFVVFSSDKKLFFKEKSERTASFLFYADDFDANGSGSYHIYRIYNPQFVPAFDCGSGGSGKFYGVKLCHLADQCRQSDFLHVHGE